MTILKNIFNYKKNPSKSMDLKFVQVWWWRHTPHCGSIILEPVEIIDNDKLKVEFVNEEGERWSCDLQADGNFRLAYRIDYTKLVDENQQPFNGKLKDVRIYWRDYQQQFFVLSSNIISADENDLWEYET